MGYVVELGEYYRVSVSVFLGPAALLFVGVPPGRKKRSYFTRESGIFIRSFDEYMGQDMQTATVWFAARPDDAPPLTANTSQRRQPRRLKPCAIDPQQSAR